MANSQTFSPDESLRLIRNMIDKTRRDVSDNSIYFLVWGWGAFLGCIDQFILKAVLHNPYHYLVWLITFVCAAVSLVVGIKQRKKERAQTYIGDTFVSGKILQYRPLVIGGIISFILAVLCAWLTYDYQILCVAGALLVSYIIPGHMLRNRYKTQVQLS